MPHDPVERKYMPIREQYIKIVKFAKKACVIATEKKGRKDYKRTCKSLKTMAISASLI